MNYLFPVWRLMIGKESLLLISRLQRTMVQNEVSTLRMTLLSARLG